MSGSTFLFSGMVRRSAKKRKIRGPPVMTTLDYAAKNLPQGAATAQVDAKTGATQCSVTPEGVVALGKQIATYQENASELAVCTKDKADFRHITVDLTKQRDSYKQEAEEWKKAAKGGSAWRRFVKAAK